MMSHVSLSRSRSDPGPWIPWQDLERMQRDTEPTIARCYCRSGNARRPHAWFIPDGHSMGSTAFDTTIPALACPSSVVGTKEWSVVYHVTTFAKWAIDAGVNPERYVSQILDRSDTWFIDPGSDDKRPSGVTLPDVRSRFVDENDEWIRPLPDDVTVTRRSR